MVVKVIRRVNRRPRTFRWKSKSHSLLDILFLSMIPPQVLFAPVVTPQPLYQQGVSTLLFFLARAKTALLQGLGIRSPRASVSRKPDRRKKEVSVLGGGIQSGGRLADLDQIAQDLFHLGRIGDDGKDAHRRTAGGTGKEWTKATVTPVRREASR